MLTVCKIVAGDIRSTAENPKGFCLHNAVYLHNTWLLIKSSVRYKSDPSQPMDINLHSFHVVRAIIGYQTMSKPFSAMATAYTSNGAAHFHIVHDLQESPRNSHCVHA